MGRIEERRLKDLWMILVLRPLLIWKACTCIAAVLRGVYTRVGFANTIGEWTSRLNVASFFEE